MQLSDDILREIDEIVARYPNDHSAILPVMHVLQRLEGYVTREAQDWVAVRLDMAPSKVEEVLSFYTMLYRVPMGRRHLQVCRSLACYLRGEEEITAHIQEKIGIAAGEKTADGKFSLERVECLGSCGTAPMMQVNDDYHENLTEETVDRLLEEWSR